MYSKQKANNCTIVRPAQTAYESLNSIRLAGSAQTCLLALLLIVVVSAWSQPAGATEAATGLDARINAWVEPIAEAVSNFVFYKINLFGADLPWIVLWLAGAAVVFTFYFNFLSLSGFRHAFHLLRGDYAKAGTEGEVSHFQALSTAVSGTVGIGNIGGVAVVISVGGPGATFWMIVAGFLSMSTKFAECVAGVKFRKVNPDGSVSGGPMYYLEAALRLRNMSWAARPLGAFYALSIVIGCFGIGNMFQSNQAFEQFVFITGGEQSRFAELGWLFGLVLASLVAVVIIGGIKSIARVTSKLVPFMALAYVIGAVTVITMNADRLPGALQAIFSEAFNPQAIGGGMLGVMILGFQRAVFSNEAGIGSAAVAHSAVRTSEPITEGYVGLMEPFIDTVVICTLTALVILTTVYTPEMAGAGVQGVELTSRAFSGTLGWSAVPLSIVAVLFAFSTLIAWSYYGLKGWTYLVGDSALAENAFKLVFCSFAALGSSVQLGAILSFSDALVFVIALPNIFGLYLLAPIIKKELLDYQKRLKAGAFTKNNVS
ncbi:MAG: alanine:cation symporter family protein [Gammaproteobacteria bacterium]|nr:alanine:cation symporter family protein [Gammaproteobacteria bacterium]NND39907.1 alanine:cation symporter family protein [Pseudomonadales bacterium]NNM12447.1 alanine:cation symporter family protein [Pseudomonadales bacterium]RZV54161.1 MAG: alanine:cation symporter family protein [Pseudomonadales bacterium]